MPRVSRKQAAVNRLEDLLLAAVKHAIRLKTFGLCTTTVEEFIRLCYILKSRLQNKRYLSRGRYRKRKGKFDLFLDAHHDEALSDKEFLHHFRVTRCAFWQIVRLIEHHNLFKRKGSDSRGAFPKPAEHQLLVLLKYLGTQGNAACSVGLSNFFGVGAGAIDDCRNAALVAVAACMEDSTYFWPTRDERKAISSRIKTKYHWPNCVGLIDGTLLPLATRPLLHGENYLSRKRFYAIVMMVVCDDQGRVLYYHIGWPGSVHDNRVWRNCKLCTDSEEMFSNKEYLLGDSAFTASKRMIPPFKSIQGVLCQQTKLRSTLCWQGQE
jgi:hypothetical protein